MKKSIGIFIAALALVSAGCSKKAQVEINSAADLAGKVVGCQAGTTGEMYVQD